MTATLTYNQKTIDIQLNKSTITDDLYVIFIEEISEQTPQYKRLKLAIHPKMDVVLQDLTLQIPTKLAKTDRVFCNGFQSWSESRLFGFDEKPDTLRAIAKPLMGYYGDYHIDFLPTKKGILYSWTYAYHITQNPKPFVIQKEQNLNFIGSLDESTAFTCLLYDLDNQQIIVKKDLAGLELNHSFPVLDVVLMNTEIPPQYLTTILLCKTCQSAKNPSKRAGRVGIITTTKFLRPSFLTTSTPSPNATFRLIIFKLTMVGKRESAIGSPSNPSFQTA